MLGQGERNESGVTERDGVLVKMARSLRTVMHGRVAQAIARLVSMIKRRVGVKAAKRASDEVMDGVPIWYSSRMTVMTTMQPPMRYTSARQAFLPLANCSLRRTWNGANRQRKSVDTLKTASQMPIAVLAVQSEVMQ